MSATVNYDSATNISHLTFSNGTSSISDILFLGDYSHSSWTLTSDGSGGTVVADPPDSGTATIDSGTTLDIVAASAGSITFTNTSGTSGALVLNDSVDFTGVIYGFAGDGTLLNSDYIDLKDIDFSHLTIETYTEDSAGTGGTLTLSDGTHTANIEFAGNYVFENFTLSNDGSGGTLIIDPPVTSSDTATTYSDTTLNNDGSSATLVVDSPEPTVTSANTALTTGTDALTIDDGTQQLSGTDQTINNGDTITGGTGADTLSIDSGNGNHTYSFGDGSHADIGLNNFEKITLTDANTASDHALTVTFDSEFQSQGNLTVDGSALTHLNGTGLTVDAHLATSDSFIFIGSAKADTLIGGSGGNNTIIGGGGGDTLVGGANSDTFVFKAVTDSQPGSGHFDTIADFNHGADYIDIAAISGLNSDNQSINFSSLSSIPTSIAAHTIDIVTSGGSTIIYANASGMAQNIGSSDMEIHLMNVTNVTSTDFIIHH